MSRAVWLLGLICFACSSPRMSARIERDAAASEMSATVALPPDDVEAVLDAAVARAWRAYHLVDHWYGCYMPTGDRITFVLDPESKFEPTPRKQFDHDPYFAEWLRSEPNHWDYDFMGVDFEAVPDGIRIKSRYGYEAGMQRVAAWIRFCAKTRHR